MGIDLKYQAIPEGKLLAYARHAPEFGNLLMYFHYLDDLEASLSDVKKLFLQLAKQTQTLHPGIKKRHLLLPRGLNFPWYIVADKRTAKQDQPVWMNVLDNAIAGDEILHPEVTDGMGHVIRYVSPMQVQEFATFLPSLLLTYSDLRAWLETAGYRDPFIFKAMFNDTWELLELLIPFYEEVAGYNEGVFVRMD